MLMSKIHKQITEKVRNLIFKGYTIVFRIGKDQIKILAILKTINTNILTHNSFFKHRI